MSRRTMRPRRTSVGCGAWGAGVGRERVVAVLRMRRLCGKQRETTMWGQPAPAVRAERSSAALFEGFDGASRRASSARLDSRGRLSPHNLSCYSAVSVKVATGWPSAYWPSAFTCTAPADDGRVRTTLALPDELVVTVRLESEPTVVVNRIVPPAALPPDCPGLRVTERFRVVPGAPFWLSPVLASEAGGLPTRIQPLCCCATPVESVPGTV